jgi:hypothetical protein
MALLVGKRGTLLLTGVENTALLGKFEQKFNYFLTQKTIQNDVNLLRK